MDTEFFRARYAASGPNRAKQSEKEYLDWVARFYEGQRFPPIAGWRKREEELAARFPAARDLLVVVGRELASEWAKDNSVRKVSTGDLQAWGRQFESAAKDEARLVAALRDVRAEVGKRAGASSSAAG